jgi:hypothetical protein
MTNLFAKKHLRLVSHSTKDDVRSEAVLNNSPCEKFHSSNEANFSLSLYFLREVNILRSYSFSEYMSECDARALFDVRIAPRLDFIAPNRGQAFRRLSDLAIDYVDIVGAIDSGMIGDIPEDWCGLIGRSIDDLHEKNHNSLFFIFDNEQILRSAKRIIPSSICQRYSNFNFKIQVIDEVQERIAM